MRCGLGPKKLVFLDETCAKTNMTRLYGRAPIGQRLVDRTPHGHWVTNTYVCGLRYNGVVAPHAFVGAMVIIANTVVHARNTLTCLASV